MSNEQSNQTKSGTVVEDATPFHTAARINDFMGMVSLFENGAKYPTYIPGGDATPLAIACEAPVNPRMVTLLCLHGADPLLELQPGMLENIPLLIATKINTVAEGETQYYNYYSCVMMYIQTIMLAHQFGQGIISEDECLHLMEEQTIKKAKWCEEHKVKYEDFDPTAKSFLQE